MAVPVVVVMVEKPVASVVAVDDDKQSYRRSSRKHRLDIQSSDSEDSVVHVCRPVQKKKILKKDEEIFFEKLKKIDNDDYYIYDICQLSEYKRSRMYRRRS